MKINRRVSLFPKIFLLVVKHFCTLVLCSNKIPTPGSFGPQLCLYGNIGSSM